VATAEPTPERWEYRARTNDYRCRTHGTEFWRGDVCPDCADEPLGAPEIEVGDESEHDKELARWESSHVTLAKKLHRIGEEMLDAGGRDRVDAAKLIAEGAKLYRIAIENREKRAAREHDRMLVRHRREMAGLRASH
jgi:hypothetical protein